LIVLGFNTSLKVTFIKYIDCFRHEENGIQDPSVARKVLRLQRLQECHRN